mgnify:CR=1 FL=1
MKHTIRHTLALCTAACSLAALLGACTAAPSGSTTAPRSTSVSASVSATSASASVSTPTASTSVTTEAARDYNAVFAEYGLEPTDELLPWACYFVDHFPVEDCDVRFAELSDGAVMLVTHFHDVDGVSVADLYLCALGSDGFLSATWTYRLYDNIQGEYSSAYLVEADGLPALLLYGRRIYKGSVTERYDMYRFDAEGERVMVSAEQTSVPESEGFDAALFASRYQALIAASDVVCSISAPWYDGFFYDESLPAYAFSGRSTPLNRLRRFGDNFLGLTTCTVSGDSVELEGRLLRRTQEGYQPVAILRFSAPSSTPVSYRTKTGEYAVSELSAFLTEHLSAFGTVYFNGSDPVYRFRTQNGGVTAIEELPPA